jgi:membrane-associated phospholipid phosphatase
MKILVHALLGAWVTCACAAGGPFGIDQRWSYDDSGIWKRGTQRGLEYATVAVAIGGALWEGGETRLGRTYWEALDAGAMGLAGGEVAKRVFTRERPAESNDADAWFKGDSHHSFPSTEVSSIAGIVTPFALEYGHEYPAVWSLEALPAVIGIGRMKVQAHWQSDVLAGWALGSATGYYAHRHDSPLTLAVMPHAVVVGIKHRF